MDTNPWEWSPEEVKRLGYRVVDLIADYLKKFPEGSVFRPVPAKMAAEFLNVPLPEEGQPPDVILGEFAVRVAPYPFGNGHPRFWGWVNSPPTILGVFAEALAAAMNPSCAGGNHAAIHVERQVLNWFKQIAGFSPEGAGLLVSGGSMATLTALAVARHVKAGVDVRADGVQSVPRPLTLYTSAEGHGCIRKAVELLGLGSNALRSIPVDENFRMRVPELKAAIGRDLEAGCRPVAVIASAGTVNTGAIDPLREIREVCDEHDLWFHVDGAYGGPAVLTSRYRAELESMGRADSLALDPHKWLYVPVEAGLVLVRDAAALRDTFSVVPPYLRTDGGTGGFAGGLPWFSEYGFQLTRGFRALKVWMALKCHGARGYAALIGQDLALAEHLARRVRQSRDLELMAPPSLSIVCFRFAPQMRRAEEELDNLNKALLEKIQTGGQAFLSSTTLGGRFVLRACIVNPRSKTSDIDFLVDLVERTGRELDGAPGK